MQSTHPRVAQELRTVSDDELLRRLADLLAGSRHTEADLVAHIGEVDARRLYAREATPSMFVYCTERLRLSEGEACLRIAAARASREHPVLLEMLADGRLHLSAIAKIAPHLTPENRDALLRRATHRTKREIEELVAELQPRPDVAESIRKLPAGRLVARVGPPSRATLLPAEAGRQTGPCLDTADARSCITVPEQRSFDPSGSTEQPNVPIVPRPGWVDSDRSDASHASCVTTERREGSSEPKERSGERNVESGHNVSSDPDPAPRREVRWIAAPASRPAAIEPLSPARYRVEFTASAELRDKLLRLQALMRSSIPDADLATVVETAVTDKLERLEARRFGRTRSPRKTLSETDTAPKTRHVPAAVKRAIDERDGGRCRFVDLQGRRCTARAGLEFHHGLPWAVGGDHAPGAMSLLCRTHNRTLAEVDFGRKVVGARRRTSTETAVGQMTLETR